MISMSYTPMVSEISGASVVADARFGGNGSVWGDPEYQLADGAYDLTTGRTTWDSDPSDGFASGDVDVCLHVTSGSDGGAADFAVAGSADGDLQLAPSLTGGLNDVQITVGARYAGMQVQWKDACVQFYKDGVLQQSVSLSSALEVDPTAEEGQGQRTAEIISDYSDNDEVIITGKVSFACSDASIPPDSSSMFAEAAVFATQA